MSAIYPKWMEAVIQASSNSSLSGTVKAALVDTADVSYNAAHDMYDDISAGVVGTPATLGSKTYTNGVFDATDVADYDANAGDSAEAIVIYIDTGTPSTSRLVAWIDSFTATPSGVDTVDITWDATGIVRFLG